jgi:hypothetical protein
VIFDERNDAFLFTLHPLLIYSSDDVFILQSSDLKRSVEYLCHDTGSSYVADQIFEDFKERLGRYITGEELSGTSDGEAIYESCLKMSLLDGAIEDDERLYLEELREQLDVPRSRAQELERIVFASFTRSSPEAIPPVAPTDPKNSQNSIGLIFEQQTKLLKQFGEEILRFREPSCRCAQPRICAGPS